MMKIKKLKKQKNQKKQTKQKAEDSFLYQGKYAKIDDYIQRCVIHKTNHSCVKKHTKIRG